MESAVDVDLIAAMTLVDVAAEDARQLGIVTFIGLLVNSPVCSKPGWLNFNALDARRRAKFTRKSPTM
jgi:hypothetical protein